MMHENHALLNKLFTALDKHDHEAMASCYHEDAHFRDIAFDLQDRKQIHSMWAMTCETDISVQFEILEANDHTGRVKLVDTYTFRASKAPPRRVRNAIDSSFVFENGLILRQDDDCDPKAWARSALGGIAGFIGGRIRLARSYTANRLLAAFVAKHPEYSSR
jgi:hypothetical protein